MLYLHGEVDGYPYSTYDSLFHSDGRRKKHGMERRVSANPVVVHSMQGDKLTIQGEAINSPANRLGYRSGRAGHLKLRTKPPMSSACIKTKAGTFSNLPDLSRQGGFRT